MKNTWNKIIIVSGLAILMAGCNSAGTIQSKDVSNEPAAPIQTSTEEQLEVDNPISNSDLPAQEPKKDSIPMTQPTISPSSSGLESLIEQAKEDLAQRLSIAITQIDLVEAKEVVWPDASLGCPQPGMKYKQVPEDGALIILQAQGTAYEYHNGGSRGLFLCEKALSKPEKPPQIDITNLTPQILDKNAPPPLTPDQGIPPGEDN